MRLVIPFAMTSELKSTIRFLKKIHSKWVLIYEEGREDILSQAVITYQGDDFPLDRIKRLWSLNRRVIQVR